MSRRGSRGGFWRRIGPSADGEEMLDGGREERGYVKGVLRHVLEV